MRFQLLLAFFTSFIASVVARKSVHWGQASRESDSSCGWPSEESAACNRIRRASKHVPLAAGEAYVVDDFLNVEEFAWLSTVFDESKNTVKMGANSLGAVYDRVELVSTDLAKPFEELGQRIHGHAVAHIQSKSELSEIGWAYRGMFYQDDVTIRRYHSEQSRVGPHADTGMLGRCLSATLHIGQHGGKGGELQTFKCRKNCSVVGWQYDKDKYQEPDLDFLLSQRNLEKSASLSYKPGRLIYFLAETVHMVTPAEDFDRDILFIWFSCLPTLANGNIKSGHLALVKHLVKQRADVSVTTPTSKVSPAWFAAGVGHVPILSYLRKEGGKMDILDIYGRSPLHMASQSGHLGTTRLLSNAGVDLNIRGKDGMTPLLLAATNGHVAVVGLLLSLGGESLGPKLVRVAVENRHCQLLQYLSRFTNADMCLMADNTDTFTSDCLSIAGQDEHSLKQCSRKGSDDSNIHDSIGNNDDEEESDEFEEDDEQHTLHLDESAFEVERLCPEELVIPSNGKVSGFLLNASHLKLRRKTLTIRICEKRSNAVGGLLAIEGLLEVVGGPGGLNAASMDVVDEEIASLLGRDLIDEQLYPVGKQALRILQSKDEAPNVHHDRNIQPRMYASVLTYLTDEVDGLEGGHTLFPTLAVHGRNLDARQQWLKDFLHERFDEDLSVVHADKGLIERAGRHMQLTNEMCPRRHDTDLSKENYFAMKPRLGLSLIMYHMVGKRKGPFKPELGEHWHAGCGHNSTKIIHLRFANLNYHLSLLRAAE